MTDMHEPKTQTFEVRSLNDVQPSWGQLETLDPNHPVSFREPAVGEKYEYYGRVAVEGLDFIAQRWQGGDKFKDASPVKIAEMEATYTPAPDHKLKEFGFPLDSVGIYLKMEPTRVLLLPAGVSVTIFTAEKSEEVITGSRDAVPEFAIAFDTQDRPYKFPYKKNLSEQGDLPPAYSKR